MFKAMETKLKSKESGNEENTRLRKTQCDDVRFSSIDDYYNSDWAWLRMERYEDIYTGERCGI